MTAETAPAPPSRRRLPWLIAIGAALLLALVLLLVAGTATWVWNDESAQHALLRRAGIALAGERGRLNGGPFAVDRLEWHGSGTTVVVEGLRWRDAHWQWRPWPGGWLGLTLDAPQADRVRVTLAPAPKPKEPPQPPASLRLPVELVAAGLRVGSIELDGQPLATGLAADVHVGADRGARHRIERLRIERAPLALTGEASIGADAPLPVTADVALASAPGTPAGWRATAKLQGPLQRLDADAALRTEAGAQLTARAALAPFASWPLAALALRTIDLDLSLLAHGLPQTRLGGEATLADVAAGQPLQLDVALDNAAAGAWDAGRLPVRSVRASLRGRPSEPERLAFDGIAIELGDRAAAGRVTGSGRWERDRLALTARLDGVQAARLDGRAPGATLDGSVTLALDGLPLPGTVAPAAPAALDGSVQAEIDGRLPAPARGRPAPPPLQLRADAAFALPADGTLRAELRRLDARAGGARAQATANARRDAAGRWAMKTTGSLARFDVAAWWPAATRGGATDLNGGWRADVQWPAAAADLLAALRGSAELTLRDSRVAGVPLAAKAALQATPQGLAVDAGIDAASNRLDVAGKAAPGGGNQDWRAHVQAPALAALAPLLALAPGAAAYAPTAGALDAEATASGRWPALRTEGRLQVDGVKAAQLQVGRGSLRWAFNGTALDAPLAFDLALADVAESGRRLDRLQASLAGSLREHRLQIEAASALRPPAWAETAMTPAPAGAPGSLLQLQARGQWRPATAATSLGAGEWRGTLQRLRAAPRADNAAPWLAAANVDAAIALDAQGRPTRMQLGSGRVEAFGGAIAWTQAQWQAGTGGAPARVAADGRIEPLQVAPLLERLQPGFGWGGDLALGGHFAIRSAGAVDADVLIERVGGDLRLAVDGVPRDLGLTALRVSLAAHRGRWQLTEALAGREVGVLEGSQTVDAPADALVPPPQAALQGKLALQIADVAVWTPLLPPGWRLGGALQADATLGGNVGAPTYAGALAGHRLLVRNIFEGVNLRDGEVDVALEGTDAVVRRLDFATEGGGALRVRGRVALAAPPQATLQVTAERVRALDRVDRRIAVSGTADVALRAGRLAVTGRFAVDDGLVDVTAADAPSLDDDILVVGRADAAGHVRTAADAKPAPAALAGADVDVRVDLANNVRVRGRGLDARLRGVLRITTTATGALAVRGTINTTEGTYNAYGQNLAIDRGAITFAGDLANPRLDILAIRADIDERVGVVVSGPAVDPRVRLYSEPDMPEFDQLTWLLTGHAPEGLGRDETALLQRAALALLAGDRGSSEGFLQKLGISQLSVGRTDGGDTALTIGKQVSKRLSVAYERALTAAGGTWELLYRIAGRITLRARTGYENSVDVIWRWQWE